MTTMLVTGGTGTLGRHVVARLGERGHDVRVLSRHSAAYPLDLRDGSGLDAALAGVDVVVHCASTQTGGDEKAAGNLVAAAQRAGVGHLVYISIVGVDLVPLGHYATKLRVEKIIEGSGIGWTVLRTTQFHDLVFRILQGVSKLPMMPVASGVRIQPIETGEVADRLTELATGAPAGRVADMGGPEVRTLRELAQLYLRATGRRRVLVPLWIPGRTFRALQQGRNLAPDHAVGRRTFEDFLREWSLTAT
ncbi:NAD(P)H-binding protein [Streptomyces sp. NPDC002133]|uniref:SDR family oxidoreductase n=1 Tax=Streptomyces sp. NPDC002133 TaxID=3154409 RepID=UPI00332EAB5E